MKIRYDQEGDILILEFKPKKGKVFTFDLDDIVVEVDTGTWEVYSLEILFLSERLREGGELKLPVSEGKLSPDVVNYLASLGKP